MDLSQVIAEIESHCAGCKFARALQALRDLRGDEKIVTRAAAAMQPPPAGVPVPRTKRPRKFARSTGDFEKPCNKCHVVKPVSAFPKNKGCKDGHTGICCVCTAERSKRSYAERMKRKRKAAAPEMLRPALDKIAADTEKLKADGKFRCDPCHGVFLTKAALDGHNCVARKRGSDE